MPIKPRSIVAALAAALSFSAFAADVGPRGTLKPFRSEAELAALLKSWADQQRRAERRARSDYGAAVQSAPAAAPALAKAAEAAADSITNVQHAGVDEGGIVKLHSDYLVILRRGRLFTVHVDSLKTASIADAFGNGIDPRGAWYDEMLISGNTVAVIGYSYQRGGTEIGLFGISALGKLAYKATYHLRSNDYYSSRNYASRLIGSKLVFYTPLYLDPWSAEPFAQFPAMRKWRAGATQAEFKRIAPATRIYRTDEPLDPRQGLALHSVTSCDLAAAELACESSAVLGPAGRVFYVSPGSVYVWNVKSALFRIPLDGAAPSALRVSGSPIDQFSFLEGSDGHLNVLVRPNGRGEAMWSSERGNARDLAMLRVPLSSFSDGSEAAPREAYQALPAPQGWGIQNRFVGSYLLYGAGRHGSLYALRYAIDNFAHEVPLGHGVDRIEALGDNAVAAGASGVDLTFTSLRLGSFPVAADRYTRKGAAQGETRSHGFFYKADNRYEGLLGLPIISAGRNTMRHQLRHESASLLYLRNQGLTLSELGTLDSRPASGNDGCRASCVDWYGNSRPLFLKNRVYALMGYEIVEGRLDADKIVETRRVDFSPRGGAMISR